MKADMGHRQKLCNDIFRAKAWLDELIHAISGCYWAGRLWEDREI